MTTTTERPRALCTVCGSLLDPAAAAGHDGTPDVYDRHPGCDKTDRHLHVVKGATK